MRKPKAQIHVRSLDVAQQSLYPFRRQLLVSDHKDQERMGFVHEANVVIPAFATCQVAVETLSEPCGLTTLSKAHLHEVANNIADFAAAPAMHP
ncbi:hypothetical protein AO275_01890 [Pseudomonas viridiflava]|nr:hypothetical protein AO275_01890 [Pseudomonas viridiflava]